MPTSGLPSKIRIVEPGVFARFGSRLRARGVLDQRRSLEGKSLMNEVEPAETVAVSASAAPTPEIDSVALQRLIEEVRTSEPAATMGYNRTHNRHNR
ncbi:YhhA family cyclophane-containing RiPP [Streptomyces sp. CBMA29]|uniref:YhhA family cyclophane-containing RiPP n=1 Tax=Streptomyces sp. CBMA29 TaxID=1896314 RepID=UPI00397FF6CA